MSLRRGQLTTSPPPTAAGPVDELEIVEDESAFDRPTVIPSKQPEELLGELAIEDSAILRRGSLSQPRLPAIDSARLPAPSLGDEIDLWGGGSRVPSSPPPRSQMPTIAESDPLSFDLSISVPPPTRRADEEEFSELKLPPPQAPGEFRFRKSSSETVPEPLLQRSVPDARPSPRPEGGRSRTGSGGPVVEMRDRFALGDFTGALSIAESLLQIDPSNAEAARYAENSRDRLRQMYAARLGSLDRVPRVVIPPDQVRWLSLDHRAGFVLSCVDGYSSIEEILDVSGMPPLDALRVLYELLQQRIIAVG